MVKPPARLPERRPPAALPKAPPAAPADGATVVPPEFTAPPPATDPPIALPAPPAVRSLPEANPPRLARLVTGFLVQAGVFSSPQRAEELHARLTLHGIPSTLEARVQVGPFKTQAEAEAARKKMRALGIEGVILPPAGNRRR
ncbi:MAG: SPOR domain-containing protein [Zoogloeaceae bacterium]|nr:SPOR domain-containing protein [Zoogloeaceae bacterium]